MLKKEHKESIRLVRTSSDINTSYSRISILNKEIDNLNHKLSETQLKLENIDDSSIKIGKMIIHPYTRYI